MGIIKIEMHLKAKHDENFAREKNLFNENKKFEHLRFVTLLWKLNNFFGRSFGLSESNRGIPNLVRSISFKAIPF